jgi:hypothetical protein
MAKSAKIERTQKEFLKAMKKKFTEDPKPKPNEGHNLNPTLIPYAYPSRRF